MEVIAIGRLSLFAGFECLVASFVAYSTAILAGSRHAEFPAFTIAGFDFVTAGSVAIAGVVFGLSVVVFVNLTHFVERSLGRLVSYPPLRPVFGGILLVALYAWEGSYRFAGLGLGEIQAALRAPGHLSTPAFKAFFTALTIGSGFKGGEFVPLVFIGATLGSALSIILPVSFQLLASVGFAAVFAGAANTPIACSLMAVELFGYRIAPYAVIACFMSYFCSGHRGIYRSQRVHARKDERVRVLWSRLRGKPRG
jgi:H+/Cl- antiporter ClcA